MRLFYKDDRKVWQQLIVLFVLLVFIVVIFVGFTKENNERIIRQNERYVADAAMQVADRVDDVLMEAHEKISILAQTCEAKMTAPKPTRELLDELEDTVSFNYLEYVDMDGINYVSDGSEVDASDRPYYIEGIKGKSGTFVTTDSRATHETLLTFYTPLYYEGEIVGVLNGIYRQEAINNIISTTFFGTQAQSYLCMKDGTVVTSYGIDSVPENLLDGIAESSFVDDEVLREIRNAFETGEEYGFRYAGTAGPGNAYLASLSVGSGMLMITFPSRVTDNMIENANKAGVRLEVLLILLFGVYILFLLIRNYRQKKKLVSENQEISRIVESVTQLFSRFLVVDLERDRYEYLEKLKEEWPQTGCYSKLIKYLAPRYTRISGEGDLYSMISREYIQSHLTKDTPYLQFEYQVQSKGRQPGWENISILSLKKENGVTTMVLFAIQDVTILKNEELRGRTALKEAFQAADEASHAKSDFLSRMSHDIRTPLNAIMGMTTVAMMHIDEPERVKDCLNKIGLSGRHLLALINNVLDMSKIESGRLTLAEDEIDLKELVDGLLAIVGPQSHDKKQQLQVDISGIIHEKVIGDSLRLQQVFVNIMGNAVKFTPEGGKISFHVHEQPGQVQGRSSYEFVCEDTGVGMSQEFMDKIFEPFTRAGSSVGSKVEGTGLGMSITRNIVRMMNGDIRVESQLGVGSRFIVTIFLKLQEEKEISDQSARGIERGVEIEDIMALEYEGKRVLLVEDNELNMEITVELLGMIGIQVEQAFDGQQAVDILQEKPPHYYDLIFMDIRMPVMNGYEATRKIRGLEREDLQNIPIVAMSADAFSDDIQRAKEAGMNDHVAKPVELPKLAAALQRWIK